MVAERPDPFVVDFPTLWVALDWVPAHCVIPDGFRKGEPYEPYDWQLWCLANFYRIRPDVVWNPVDPVLAPAFHYRRGQIVLPQKAGKGPYTATQCCLQGVGPCLFAGWAAGGEVYDCRDWGCGCGWSYEYAPGEPMGMPWPTPLIQVTAFSEDNTDNVYKALRPMIDHGPLADLIPRTGEEFIRLPGGGEIAIVTSSAKSRLGNRVTYAPQDETGVWTDTNKMTEVATTQRRGLSGMGGRAEETTNGWDPTEYSVAQRTAESGKAWDPASVPLLERGLMGRGKDVFRYHPQAGAHLSYTDKRQRRQIHQHVYGSSLRSRGGHVDLDAIEAEAAEIVEKDPQQAERFYGNRCPSGRGSWLRQGLWAERQVTRDVDAGTKVCAGFDGSDSEDWTALRLETLDGFGFTPTYGPDQRPTIWDPDEFGGRIPRGEVHAAVDEVMRRYRVLRMYCDPRDWQTEIESWALAYGSKRVMEWPTNRIAAMHECLVRFVTDLATGQRTVDRCPITERHVGNARRIPKPGERYILGKASEPQKIDAAMADTLAHEATCDAIAAGARATDTRRRVVVLT
jgi:hypothetical protein